jgi:CHAD domain-containing protein
VAPRSTLTLDPALPPWDGLLAAFASVLAYAAAQVGRAEDAPAKAVHEYRKSIRRARAAVRLVRPLLKEKRYRRLDGALRQAVLDTSFVRDAEVLGDTIDELPRAPAVEAAAAALSDLLEAQQATACAPAATREVLRRGAEQLTLLPLRFAKALPARLDQARLEDALRASYRRARRRRREALAARSDEAIHGWRKRTKELRYQLELLEPAPQPRERALGRVAKGLGVVTDLIVLRDAVRAHADDLGAAHVEVLVSTLDRMIPARFDEVAGAAAPCFEDRARAFARAALAPAPPTVEGDGSAGGDEAVVDARSRASTPRPRRAPDGPHGLRRPALALPTPPAAALVRAAPVMPRTAPGVPSTRAPRLR